MNLSIHYGNTLAPIGSQALAKTTSSNSFDNNLPADLTWQKHIALRAPKSWRNFLRFTISEIIFGKWGSIVRLAPDISKWPNQKSGNTRYGSKSDKCYWQSPLGSSCSCHRWIHPTVWRLTGDELSEELWKAYTWWMAQHNIFKSAKSENPTLMKNETGSLIAVNPLPIASQVDGHACGILANNALHHLIEPHCSTLNSGSMGDVIKECLQPICYLLTSFTK